MEKITFDKYGRKIVKGRRIVLRTDAGLELGRFPSTHEAKAYAETLDADTLKQVLVIEGDTGVVMARRWPDDCLAVMGR
jgi:hypothetical protein